MVLDHDGALQRLSGGWGNQTDLQDLETLVEAKHSEGRVAILGGFEKRVVSAEERCKGRATEVRLQCKMKALESCLFPTVEELSNATAPALLEGQSVPTLETELAKPKVEEGLLGEVTLLKVSVHSVNRTLHGLKNSFGKVVREVGRANLTWQEREERLAQQVKGVVHLVGQQASMLGAGERRLTRLKGELQDLRRRLGTELQGCRSTALGVRKEVTEVGGRVARVEGQCSGLARLAEDLELIRGELEKHME
ncbi:hypothetical protein P4O66_022986, partial [Electrophorus voltai]